MAASCPARARLPSATATATPPPSISMLERRRPIAPRLVVASASSGKGFGGSGGDDKSSSSSSANKPLLRQALDRASPIDPREASRGRVDVATVKSWKGLDVSKPRKAGDDDAALGELELKSFAPGGGSSPSPASSSSSSSPPAPPQTLASQPLYEALARRLSVLQASGALAEPAAASTSKRSVQKRKLPRFEDWRWKEGRYVQFLSDCLAVHSALEAAVGEALGAAEGALSPAAGGGGGGGGAGGEGEGGGAERLAAFAALSYLGASSGLCRAAEIAEDLAAISETSAAAAAAAAATATAGSSDGGGSGSGSGGERRGASPPSLGPKPSASASATARYLLALGSRAAREVVSEEEEERRRSAGGWGAAAAPRRRTPGGGGGGGGGGSSSRRKGAGSSGVPASASAALRLLANCYALHVTHLTTGMRVGASASEALSLLRRRGAGFYQAYPDGLDLAPRRAPLLLSLDSGSGPSGPSGSAAPPRDNKGIVDPLRAFRSAVDGAGRVLSPPPPPAAAPAPPGGPPVPPPPPQQQQQQQPSPLLLGEVEGELVAAVRRAASLFEPLASAEP